MTRQIHRIKNPESSLSSALNEQINTTNAALEFIACRKQSVQRHGECLFLQNISLPFVFFKKKNCTINLNPEGQR